MTASGAGSIIMVVIMTGPIDRARGRVMGIVRTDIVAGHAPIPIGVIRTVMVMIAAMGTVRVMLGGVAIDVM